MNEVKYNIRPLLRWLLLSEGGVKAEGCDDSELKPAYEKNRKKMFANDPKDRGGATLCGVTYHTFVAATKDDDYDHFLQMSYEQWARIVERLYWNPTHAGEYGSLPLALVTADFAFNSGVPTAARKLQDALNRVNDYNCHRFGDALVTDGIIGKKTLGMIQQMPEQVRLVVCAVLTYLRRDYLRTCVANGGIHKKFEKGLLRRSEQALMEAMDSY